MNAREISSGLSSPFESVNSPVDKAKWRQLTAIDIHLRLSVMI